VTNDEKLAALTAARKSVARSGLSEEDSERTLVTISLARFQRMNAVIEAAKAFKISMTGEWPADHYQLLVKTLDELEKE